ncbi:MAG: DUF1684 domain-containing protein [Calditrichales bacterium]|nr:MAG: DUF1684 domain-containing protein [Calditrichales bacterium]
MNNRLFHILRYLPLLVLLWLFGFGPGCESIRPLSEEEKVYVKSIDDWHSKRIDGLKRENGWLSLAGLYWLDAGPNTFGSDAGQNIRFPAGKAAGKMGIIYLEGDRIHTEIVPGVAVMNGTEKVDTLEMLPDATGKPTILTYGPLSWLIIKRDDRYGVRLRDNESDVRLNFKGIERFPVRPEWRIKAQLEAYDPPKNIEVPSVLGTSSNEICIGALVFSIEGKTYRLDPLGEPGEKSFFIIFADATNGDETYGAGRFLYIDQPGDDGITYIDFNKAYNPPCAFTRYATCPLPPSQNILPLAVTAGEKYSESL